MPFIPMNLLNGQQATQIKLHNAAHYFFDKSQEVESSLCQ